MTTLNMLNLYFHILLSSICLHSVHGFGRVTIGILGSNGTFQPITFTADTAGTRETIPVYIEAFNDTNPLIEEPIIGSVTVTCEVSRPDTGFSNGVFTPALLSQATPDGTVTISSMTAGRSVDLQCYGTSQTAGVTQFTRTNSISNAVSLTIFSVPTVSICDSDVLDTDNEQQFVVEFSVAVANNPVTVTCIMQPNTGTLNLTIPRKDAQLGIRQMTMEFTRVRVGNGVVNVVCTALDYTASSAVTFQIRTPTITLYPQDFTTTTTKFDLLVLLNSLPSTATLGLNCIANRYTSYSDAESALLSPPCAATTPTTTTTTTAAPTSTTPADNVTSTTATVLPDWSVGTIGALSPSKLPGVVYSRVSLTRNLLTSVSVTEYIVTSCCTTTLASNLNTAALTVVNLSPGTIDWTLATANGAQNSERSYPNPAFVDFSPCPCDVTKNLCDINCCCDSDCTAAETATFLGCIEGLPGGQSAPYPEYDCQSSHFDKEDWFPLMCVEREYNSLLGFFYATTDAVRILQNFNSKAEEGQQYYTYKRSITSSTASTNGYRSGDIVRSAKLNVTQSDITIERKGTVALPQRTLTGACLNTAPVPYLTDLDSQCTRQLTTDASALNSAFSALSYLESTSTRDPSCPNVFGILGNPNDQTLFSETAVNYYCATDLTPYVKNPISESPVTTSTLFDYTLPSEDCTDYCGNDICTDFNAQATSTSTSTLPPRCTFDNGYTRPPVPELTGGGTWNNSVLEVRYDIYWNGSNIQRLSSTVIMGDVDVTTSGVLSEVTQKFQVRYIHTYGGLPNATADNYRQVDTAFARSGKPGYNVGLPILSGSRVINTTTNGFLYINTNTSRQMALWDTGFDGLCYNAGRRTITFGEDTFSSCNLKLGIEDLRNCTSLRKLVINRLNNLMAADYIGRYGNSNYLNILSWIQVTRDDLTDICAQQTEQSDDTILSYNVAGLCTEMISGIQLEVMYAITGKQYGQPINEIIGAHISYTTSTWQMSCNTDTTTCSTGGHVETFAVTSTVRFTKVPGNTPVRKQRWEEDYDESLCSRDVCWEELIYPISSSYEGESQQYTLLLSLFILLFFLGFIVFLRPWWYIL